jgi:hypothetical protein
MLSISKLKRAKNFNGGYPIVFFPGPPKISSCPPTSRKYTRIYQRKQN